MEEDSDGDGVSTGGLDGDGVGIAVGDSVGGLIVGGTVGGKNGGEVGETVVVDDVALHWLAKRSHIHSPLQKVRSCATAVPTGGQFPHPYAVCAPQLTSADEGANVGAEVTGMASYGDTVGQLSSSITQRGTLQYSHRLLPSVV